MRARALRWEKDDNRVPSSATTASVPSVSDARKRLGIDELLETEEESDREWANAPVGLEEYYFSQHTKNMRAIEAFQWDDEWIKARPILLMWFEHEYEEWWEEQAWEEDGFRCWLEGNPTKVHGDSYLGELVIKLHALYRERIVQYHPCSICGKATSEKYPMGHRDHLVRLGQPDPDVYPDGKPPKGMPTDDIQYKRVLMCEECWRRDILKEKKK